ncbi:hypothetical protein QYF50_23425 [Paenibacillus vini]|uniref:hypothetical protein n=1 Tax=Paenibacillus vini TaxID=1476024 RepID=UPI0025B7293D|nr:hypothetical protein [Paenibacillus vini]MDN4070860.1 hypothetical protein [Paenibacillus vini]
MTKPNTQYRYNRKPKHFEATIQNHKPLRTLTPDENIGLMWEYIDEIDVPDYVRERCELLIYRRRNPRKNPISSKPLYWTELKVSLDYITRALKKYFRLKANQELQTVDDRLDLVKSVLDQSLADLKLAYGDTDIKEHDCIVVGDYLADYISRYLYKDFSDKYMKVIDLLVDYVMAVTIEREDKAQERFEKKHLSVEEILKSVPDDDEDFCIDDYIKIKDKITEQISENYKIYFKKSKKFKDRPCWADRNELKVTYEDLNDEQKALHDEMERLYDLAKQTPRGSNKQKLLNSIANEIKQVLKQQTTYEVERSGSKKKVDSNLIELTNHKIFEYLDYTNKVHILALINHYYILWETYHTQPGSEMYIVLQEFKENVEKVKLARPEHYDILNSWLYHGSDAKKNAEYLNMDTEKMNRTIKTSISKKISEYFQQMSDF